MDTEKESLELMKDAINKLSDGLKLFFAFSTGAVVLFVHLMTETSLSRASTVLLAASVICFGFSATRCIHAIVGLSVQQVGAARAIIQKVEHRGDFFLKNSGEAMAEMDQTVKAMEKFFIAGILCAVAFVVIAVVSRFL
jgi:hypothetical protein